MNAVYSLISVQNDPEAPAHKRRQTAREGVEHVDSAIQLDPTCGDYWLTKGILVAEGFGDIAEGVRLLEHAAELSPDHAPHAIRVHQTLRKLRQLARQLEQTRHVWVVWLANGLAGICMGTLILTLGAAGRFKRFNQLEAEASGGDLVLFLVLTLFCVPASSIWAWRSQSRLARETDGRFHSWFRGSKEVWLGVGVTLLAAAYFVKYLALALRTGGP